jgi:peptidoglycan-associated lipoprotein
MRSNFWIGFALLFVIIGLIFTTSCAKKKIISKPPATQFATAEEKARRGGLAEERARQEALAEKQRLLEERLREEDRQRRERRNLDDLERFLSEDIHFEFDKSSLLPEACEILRRKAKWLKAHPDVLVIIEGHCDERGTSEYNVALGDRRAWSARSYMVNLGIASERLTTISYGEEMPLDPGHNEEAWARNRRAHFAID